MENISKASIRRGKRAAAKKGEAFDICRLAPKPQPKTTTPRPKPKRVHKAVLPYNDRSPVVVPRALRHSPKKEDCEVFDFVVGKVNGTSDDWATHFAIQTNPRVLAKQCKAPKLEVLSNMYQKYQIDKLQLIATPLVSAAAVSGTILMISEGGSANSPTPPENVNACKERNGVTVAIGESRSYTWTPPKRLFLTRPDGDVSETSGGFMFVNTYLPTTTVLEGTPFLRPLWLISAQVSYKFSVFEDPAKNIEDAVISESLTGKLVLQQDSAGAPVLTGETVAGLRSVMLAAPDNGRGVSSGAKNGILLVTGIVATAAAMIPGPLGILIRAGCVVAKLIMAAIPSKSANGKPEFVPALKIFGSVDDALEGRPLTAPGLQSTDLAADGRVTTITVGQNPVTTTSSADINVRKQNMLPPTSAATFVNIHNGKWNTDIPKMTTSTGTKFSGKIMIDNYTDFQTTPDSQAEAELSAEAFLVCVDMNGQLWYAGPVTSVPSNAMVAKGDTIVPGFAFASEQFGSSAEAVYFLSGNKIYLARKSGDLTGLAITAGQTGVPKNVTPPGMRLKYKTVTTRKEITDTADHGDFFVVYDPDGDDNPHPYAQ